MAKNEPQIDVLVLGEHPSAYFAAALMAGNSKINVMHTTIPGDVQGDRLVIINPEFFKLHALLEPLRRKLDLTATYGLQFLSPDPAVRGEYRNKSTLAFVTSYKAVRSAMMKVAESQGVDMQTPKTVHIHHLDEHGAQVTVGKLLVKPKVLVLAGPLPEQQQKLLGLPESWGADVVHRYTFLKLVGTKWADLGGRPIIPMCLNLKEKLCWGWLLPSDKSIQLSVEQPIETVAEIRPLDLLSQWVDILRANEVLLAKGNVPIDSAESIDLPLSGALMHEGVANRTLLIGPAGGFYSACSEDIYPNCWSSVYAADAVKKALKELHLQDALQPYRYRWRTTLGDYLRGPQQNLRFLLPMVYRNQKMTARLTESILMGKSVVR
jgi:flavin-dependent dehydrogenase